MKDTIRYPHLECTECGYRDRLERPAEEGLLGSLGNLDRDLKLVGVVANDPNAARLLRRILQAHVDYQVLEAKDGRAWR